MSMNDFSFMETSTIENLKRCLNVLKNMRGNLEREEEFWFGPEDDVGISITPNDQYDRDLLIEMIVLMERRYNEKLTELGEVV